MDVLITSIVLGTIIAGAFGLKKKQPEWEPPLWKKIIRIFLWK